MSHFKLNSNQVVIIAEDGTATDLNTMLADHAKAAGHKYSMVVATNNDGGRRLVMPEAVYQRSNDAGKAIATARAHLAAYDVISDAGIPQDDVAFYTLRRDRQSNTTKATATIFLNNIEGIANSFRNGTGAQASVADTTSADLTKVVEAYYAANGEEAPPAALSSSPAALLGWFRNATTKLKSAEVKEIIEKAEEEGTDVQVADL